MPLSLLLARGLAAGADGRLGVSRRRRLPRCGAGRRGAAPRPPRRSPPPARRSRWRAGSPDSHEGMPALAADAALPAGAAAAGDAESPEADDGAAGGAPPVAAPDAVPAPEPAAPAAAAAGRPGACARLARGPGRAALLAARAARPSASTLDLSFRRALARLVQRALVGRALVGCILVASPCLAWPAAGAALDEAQLVLVAGRRPRRPSLASASTLPDAPPPGLAAGPAPRRLPPQAAAALVDGHLLGEDARAPRRDRWRARWRHRMESVEPARTRFSVVLDEGLRVGAPQRHQHLVDGGVGHRVAGGHAQSRLAGAHRDLAAARRGRRAAGPVAARRTPAAASRAGTSTVTCNWRWPALERRSSRISTASVVSGWVDETAHHAAGGVGAVLRRAVVVDSGAGRLQAGLLPGVFGGERDLQIGGLVCRELQQGHHHFAAARAGRGHDPGMPQARRVGRAGAQCRARAPGPRPGSGFGRSGANRARANSLGRVPKCLYCASRA